MTADKLDGAIRAVAPIHGVSIGRKDDKATWRIDFTDAATSAQKAAAAAVLDAFDNSDLAAARDDQWGKIKAARDAARDAGFVFQGKLVQSDDTSRANIAGAALVAQIAKAAGAPYSVDWTCADNSVMTLTGDQVIAMFMAGAQFVQTIYARGVDRRERINAAATPAAVAAINW